MARLLIEGWETGTAGDISRWTSGNGAGVPSSNSSTVNTYVSSHAGAYSGGFNYNGTTVRNVIKSGLNKSTLYARVYFYVSISSNPTSDHEESFIVLKTSGGGNIAIVTLQTSTGGVVTLKVQNLVAGSTPISGISVSASAWHLLEFKCVINATTGILEIKFDGNTTTASSQNTGSTNIDSFTLGVTGPSNNGGNITYFTDDIALDDAAYPGLGIVIARQPVSGAPTYNEFTKSSGSDAYSLWDETPVNTTNNCVSPGSGDPLRQSAFIGTFASTQTGHGTGVIGSSDTVNIAQAVINAKRSGGSGRTHEMLRRDNTTDTFSSLTLSTSDVHYAGALFSPSSYSNLNSAIQLGGRKSGGVGGQDMTINDVWLMVDYTPAANTTTTQTILGKSRIQKVQSATTTGKAAVRNTTTRTTQGRSRLQKAVLATLAGLSRIQKVVAATLGGRSAIQNTTTRTVDGRSRLQKSVLQTTQGRSRLQKVQAATIDGKSRMQSTLSQTTQGRSRLQKAVLRTINGIAMIVATTIRTIQGLARITATTLRTIQAVARIQDTTVQTIDGRSRLTKSALQTIPGQSRIQKVVIAALNGVSRVTATLSRTIQGRARIQKIGSQTVQGRSRILIVVVRTLNGISRITKQQAQTIQARARVQKVQSATLQGLSRIYKTITQTIGGIAKIGGATTQTIQALARLYKTISQTTQGRARLQKSFSQTILGQSRIGKIVLATLNGVSRLQKVIAQTLQGRSRILRTFVVVINGTARILKSVTRTIQGIARIILVTSQVINGRSRIQLVVTRTIDGRARVYGTIQKNILGRSKITLGAIDQDILCQARLIRVRQSDVFGQTRVQKVAEQSIQARSKIATFPYVPLGVNPIIGNINIETIETDLGTESIVGQINARTIEA